MPYDPSENVRQAHSLISPQIVRTPVITSKTISDLALEPKGARSYRDGSSELRLYFKCENLQKAGSFKIRGAIHVLAKLDNACLTKGLVSHSTGNHAQALALAAAEASKERGFPIPTYIVLPHNCSPAKLNSTRRYGAEVIFSGCTFSERRDMALEIHRAKEVVNIPSSDDPDIRLGQGTVALEFQEQMREMGEDSLSIIIVPCGGGGLLAGVGLACAGTGVKVFGCEPKEGGADEVVQGLKRGKRVETVDSLTVADGLRGVVGPGNWEIISSKVYVEGVYAVTDDQIKSATVLILEELKLFVEPSAAVPLAVVLYNEDFRALMAKETGETKIGIVLTGGNMSVESLVDILQS